MEALPICNTQWIGGQKMSKENTNTIEKAAKEVLGQDVKVIGENEYAVAANQAPGDVNRTDLLPTVGNYQEYHQSADYPINVGVIGWQA